MSQSIRVLIGDDSLELGISWATAFKEAGLYAITRPKMGKVLVDYVLTERPAVVILDAKTPGLDVCDIIRTLKGPGCWTAAATSPTAPTRWRSIRPARSGWTPTPPWRCSTTARPRGS